MRINKIEAHAPLLKPRLKVAAYARVSMETERLQHSLSAQVSYYSDLIQKNPDWEYAGVYADNGITGTMTERRGEFRRMLEDCEKGKINIILTKSISRFARNTVDLLETVRHLKSLGIEVRFEKENINSMSCDGELLMTILASYAQEEVRSISENAKWSIRKRFEKGLPNQRHRVYGYRWEGQKMVVEPVEAQTVRQMFRGYADGMSFSEIRRDIIGEDWYYGTIKKILENITYTGCLLLQKGYTDNPITKHQKKNEGELPQYLVEDDHEAIIDKETFDMVQRLLAGREKQNPASCFTGKIKCAKCGHHYKRSPRQGGAIWSCGCVDKSCSRRCVRESALEEACRAAFGEYNEETVRERVSEILIENGEILHVVGKNGRVVQYVRADDYRREQSERISEYWATSENVPPFTKRIRCGCCGSPLYSRPQGGNRYWRCSNKSCENRKGYREETLEKLAADALGLDTFLPDVFREKIACIETLSKDEIVFHGTNGETTRRTL